MEAFDEIKDWCKDQKLDIEILVDNSGSMKQENRRSQAMEIARAAAKVGAQIDKGGGVGITFFSDHPGTAYEDVKEADLESKFAGVTPSGGTDTLKFLDDEIKQHFDRKATNPAQKTLIVCITDGEPNGGQTERDQIKARLTEVAKTVTEAKGFEANVPELKVLFIQVGTDEVARNWLRDLDTDDAACGLLVESVFEGKDSRTVPMIFRDALREHKVKND